MGPGLAEMSKACIALDKNMCPESLEALKALWDLSLKCFKIWVSGSAGRGDPPVASLWPVWDPHLFDGVC